MFDCCLLEALLLKGNVIGEERVEKRKGMRNYGQDYCMRGKESIFNLRKEKEQSILVGPDLFSQNKFRISIYVEG